jgi:hypothetical protein
VKLTLNRVFFKFSESHCCPWTPCCHCTLGDAGIDVSMDTRPVPEAPGHQHEVVTAARATFSIEVLSEEARWLASAEAGVMDSWSDSKSNLGEDDRRDGKGWIRLFRSLLDSLPSLDSECASEGTDNASLNLKRRGEVDITTLGRTGDPTLAAPAASAPGAGPRAHHGPTGTSYRGTKPGPSKAFRRIGGAPFQVRTARRSTAAVVVVLHVWLKY